VQNSEPRSNGGGKSKAKKGLSMGGKKKLKRFVLNQPAREDINVAGTEKKEVWGKEVGHQKGAKVNWYRCVQSNKNGGFWGQKAREANGPLGEKGKGEKKGKREKEM